MKKPTRMSVKGVPREKFRQLVVSAAYGCSIQHDGWPCGSCAQMTEEYWHAILAYRGDYEDHRHGDVYRLANDIVFKADGTFSHHTFVEIPVTEIHRRIKRMWDTAQQAEREAEKIARAEYRKVSKKLEDFDPSGQACPDCKAVQDCTPDCPNRAFRMGGTNGRTH